ncbi:MAG: NAD(P)H-binding protein [Phycisphaerales bacterium]
MNTATLPYQNVLVIAATGKTGRRVVPLLERRGVAVRRGSRSGSPAFDWADTATWGPALEGMDAAYVVYTPDLAVPGAPDDLERFVEVARSKGIRKLVLLSGRGEPEARACELIVEQSGLDWTIVRASWFDQNFSEGDFAGMVADGAITLPNPDAREPFVDVDDIAEVAAESLLDTRHNGEVYEVTGPELLTYADVAQQLSDAAGRGIRYVPVTTFEFFDGMAQAGVPAEYGDLLRYLFEITKSGVNAHVTDGVQRALGRPPRSFRAFATHAGAAGAFDVAEEVSHG